MSSIRWGLILGAWGCSGGTSPSDKSGDTGAPLETGDTIDTVDTVDTTTDTYQPPAGDLEGAVLGTGGGPVIGADLRLCRGAVCRNGVTDAAGGFAFGGVPAVWHSFEVVAPDELTATVFAPLLIVADETRAVTVHALPYDGTPSPLGSAVEEHPAGFGLYLELAAGDLEPPLFADEATWVAGARVPEPLWVPVDEVPGTVLAQWYVGPFDYTAVSNAIPVRIDDEWGLADGAQLEVYVGNYLQSAWLPAGTATANGGSITGAALPNLAT
ncbi:MAG: hypothetical protein ABMA64_39590, partial [Myxococcota bacterium]